MAQHVHFHLPGVHHTRESPAMASSEGLPLLNLESNSIWLLLNAPREYSHIPGLIHCHGEEPRSEDEDGVPSVSMASYMHDDEDGFEGDGEDGSSANDLLIRPTNQVEGEWEDATQEHGPAGQCAILCGNWGGKYRDRAKETQKRFDIKSSPASIILLQEAEEADEQNLKADWVAGVPEANQRPQNEYIGFRGPEPNSSSLLICGRRSLVKGMRMLLFRLRVDGMYRKKSNGKGAKHGNKMAMSRIMVVACKMRWFRIHGGGGENADTLVLCNCHLHFMTAKKEVNNGSEALAGFFDELVNYIIEFGARVLAGDFNMALWTVVPELQARGLQANLASWFPWRTAHEKDAMIDSCCVIIIGPTLGIRKVYDASVLDMEAPAMPDGWSLMIESCTREPFGLKEFKCLSDSGYPLKSYKPVVDSRKRKFVMWTFEATVNRGSSAVAEILHCAHTDKAFFKFLFFLRNAIVVAWGRQAQKHMKRGYCRC